MIKKQPPDFCNLVEDADALKVQVIIRRLTPAALERDERAITQGLANMEQRYGETLVQDAFSELCKQHDWLLQTTLGKMSPDDRELVNDAAYEVIAGVLTEAGLRLEDNMRASDRGLALSTQAIAAVAAIGFPGIDQLGEGTDLEGVGLPRSPWWHPLSEFSEDREYMNIWASASFFVSAALGWVPDEEQSEKAIDLIKSLVGRIAPTLDTDTLLHRCRYDDRSLLKLTELVHRGMGQQFDQAFQQ
jgi:hypothetical protein